MNVFEHIALFTQETCPLSLLSVKKCACWILTKVTAKGNSLIITTGSLGFCCCLVTKSRLTQLSIVKYLSIADSSNNFKTMQFLWHKNSKERTIQKIRASRNRSQFKKKKKRKRKSGLPWWLSGKKSVCQCRRHRFSSSSRRIPHAKQLSPCLVWAWALKPRNGNCWAQTLQLLETPGPEPVPATREGPTVRRWGCTEE